MAVNSGDVVRATTEGVYNGVTSVQNTFHLQLQSATIDEADALDDIAALLEAVYALIGAFLKTVYVIGNIRVINVTQNTDVGDAFPNDTTPGTDTGGAFPPQVAAGITLKTADLSRRGRKFFGPMIESSADDNGLISAGLAVALANVIGHMTNDQTEANGTWAYGIVNSEGTDFAQFIAGTVAATMVTQRRRRVGVGI